MSKIEVQYSQLSKNHIKFQNWDRERFAKLVEKIDRWFSELKECRILVYFTFHSEFIDNAIATMYPLLYAGSALYEKEDDDDFSSACRSGEFDFAIILKLDFLEIDEIAQAVNLSHEFQHVLQYSKNKRVYLYGCIVRPLLSDEIPEMDSPVEYDADKKAKLIAYGMFGREMVDHWIERNIFKYQQPFFPRFRSISPEEDYNLEDEVLKLWEEHRVEETIASLRTRDTLSDDERKILEMYERANDVNSS